MSAHSSRGGEIEFVWDGKAGFVLTVKGGWPTAEELAQMVAELLLAARKEYARGN